MRGRDGGWPCCRLAPHPHRALSPAARGRVGEGASRRNHPGEGSGHAIRRSPLPAAPSLSLPRCAGEGSTRLDAGGKRRLGGTSRRIWTARDGGRARNAPTPATRPLSRNAGEGWGGGVLAQPPRRRIGRRDTTKPAPGRPPPSPSPAARERGAPGWARAGRGGWEARAGGSGRQETAGERGTHPHPHPHRAPSPARGERGAPRKDAGGLNTRHGQ